MALTKTPPSLNIPTSNISVKLSCIDTTGRFKLPMSTFLQPDYVGMPQLIGPSFSFLIEHPSRKPILFDLGIRRDWEALPMAHKWAEKKWEITVEKDTAEVLRDNGVDVAGGAIEAIVWSHHHWDHVGNPQTFPTSTKLQVGPGFKEAHLPGYPTRKDATLLDTDFEGREVEEIGFEGEKLKIGDFKAFDYFDDGSFYLLDTPGHSIGHMCGLARTSVKPDTFVLMGGDAAHHSGEIRPSEFLSLPSEIKPSPLKRRAGPCPGHLFEDIHPEHATDKPLYLVTANFAHDKKLADETVAGLGVFDAHENVLVMLAHDDSLVDPAQLEFFPQSMNDWFEKGIAKKVKWLFLGDFEEAIEAKEDGKEPFKWGKYP